MQTFPTYELNLTASDFLSDYETFRSATSKTYSYNKKDYIAVYKTDADYAYVKVTSGTDTLTLIVNLEFYYVYGFIIDQDLWAYQGEAYTSLEQAGFAVSKEYTIPFGDAYYEIGSYADIDAVCVETVTLETLQKAIHAVATVNGNWDAVRRDLLRMFWCLVEGVRFKEISRIVNDLISGYDYNTTFGYFYYMAERWAEISVGAAYSGKEDKSIAVYELHRLGIGVSQ